MRMSLVFRIIQCRVVLRNRILLGIKPNLSVKVKNRIIRLMWKVWMSEVLISILIKWKKGKNS